MMKKPLALCKPSNHVKGIVHNRSNGGLNTSLTNGNGQSNNSIRIDYIDDILRQSLHDSFKKEGSDADDEIDDEDYTLLGQHSTSKDASHFCTSLLCMSIFMHGKENKVFFK